MCVPGFGFPEFMDLAVLLGVVAVEIRNDLEGGAHIDGILPATLRSAAAVRGLRIASINALQRFNRWDAVRADEAKALAGYAAECGAEALVLVPTNDGTGLGMEERRKALRLALERLDPILEDAGIIGLVEPLGFASCSLRSKTEAVEAIRELGMGARFQLVHDTFHHHLAGEAALFPQETGLVHISGVVDGGLAVDGMRDEHRVLVDEDDRLDSIGQIGALLASGLDVPLSFEPFAPSVHDLADPRREISRSIAFIEAGLAARAA
ncbi:TIM barrel protein [Stappia sp. F7233]|uniref:TIM barrel protein n=1 Tax=Stappia albiluteola TaxID=2758565 RepID=A0A839ACM0_9HYPH|nr:TIM barrel protein [Stappia albiluteola]MBA5776682.1 TIM barrel protein [Stappia albiluteola]